MCNLNIIIRRKKLKNLTSFLMAVTSSSYSDNDDGDGIFFRDKIFKSREKLDLLNYSSGINKSKIIISHQRRATSGFEDQWIQPFVNPDFVLVHNGVINGFTRKKGSDTWGFFLKFLKNFKRFDGTREENIINTIKKLLDNNRCGSYSIAILDRQTDNIYYFKNTSPSIHFYKNEDVLYITTALTNKPFLSILGKEFEEVEIEDHTIYKIKGTTANVKEIGTITHKAEFMSYNSTQEIKQQADIEELLREADQSPIWGRYSSADALPCDFCGTLTHNRYGTQKICEECMNEEKDWNYADYGRHYYR